MEHEKHSNLFSLLLLLAGSSAISAKERIIERPAFTAWSGTIIEIDKVVLSEQATVLHIQAFYRPNYWINIPKVTYLVTDSGNKYQIQSADGINIDEHFYMPASGTASFTLTFPPIPESVSEFDFIEEVEDGFKIWGIRLDGKLPQPELPGDIVINKTDKNTSLQL